MQMTIVNDELKALLVFRKATVVEFLACAAVPIPRCPLIPLPYTGQWHGTSKC